MRIHYFQHGSFEGPAEIEHWATREGHTITGSHVYRGDTLPQLESFDMLVIMGGPMSVNDEQTHAWLANEKQLVRASVEAGRSVFGICLGAQMIANALGARVYRAAEKEIGWFPVCRSASEGLTAAFPEEFTPLHWHGETFDLPARAVRLAATAVVPNQGFQIGPRVIGLQFHLEATTASVQQLVENAAQEIEAGKPFQQSPETIVREAALRSQHVHPILHTILQFLTS
jgi:GMP synthase-like glutamine amidotransferase